MRGQSSKKRKYYFFDYLFWLGEMAQRHYKGEPRRPTGVHADALQHYIYL